MLLETRMLSGKTFQVFPILLKYELKNIVVFTRGIFKRIPFCADRRSELVSTKLIKFKKLQLTFP